MTQLKKVFFFNSSLPDGPKAEDLLRSMGGGTFGNIRGQNIGKTYISYGLLKILFGRPAKVDHVTNAWTQDISDSLVEKINNQYSHLIFILQDYIRESFSELPHEKITNFLEKIKIPVVPMSLCANSFNGFDLGLINRLSGAQKRFLYVLSEKSKLIGVRGNYSADILNGLGIKNVKVVGCPSFFENGATRYVIKKEWNPDKVITTATFFNRGLPNTSHILQDELYFINLLFLGGNALSAGMNSTAHPFNTAEIASSLHLLSKAMAGRLEFFSDLKKWGDFFRSNDHCLTIGTRLHSGILSINSGVPAIVTNPDARARETCEYLKIPYNPKIDSVSDIPHVYEKLDLDAMNNAYPELYKEFHSYLGVHGLAPSLTPEDTPCIEFPQMSKIICPKIFDELHQAFTDLADSLEREVVTLETFGGEKAIKARDRLRVMSQRYPSLSSVAYYASLKVVGS